MPEDNEKPAGTPDFDAGALSAAGSAKLHGDPECLILGRISQLGSSTGDPQFRLNDLGTKLGPILADAEPSDIEARLTALEASFNGIETAVGDLRAGASAEMSQLRAENAKLKEAINELREIIAATSHTHGQTDR